MSNVSEFERNKPRETYTAIIKAKEKYEALLKETVIMEDTDAVRVEMARHFLRDLKEIFQKFKSGQ
mgnify:CR=1 FL=1|jgi:hypothetical protein|tara:strand:+ start:44 stop:241 length:198 start_codon:yes stop_codon:yes gene_type:complete